MNKKLSTFITPLILSAALLAAPAFSQGLELEAKVPGTLQGELGYASMKYWVTTADGTVVQLWSDTEVDENLTGKSGQQVSLNGATVTYSDGSVYFSPKFAAQAAKAALEFTIDKNEYDDVIRIQLDGQTISSVNDYYTASIDKEFTTSNGKVALIQLGSGGTACPAEYMLVIARHDAQPLVTPTFGTCSDIPEITTKGEDIFMNFPGNPDEKWAWDHSAYRLYKQ
ncbi:hypothetical protein [Oceanisphaera sp. W20_SRM_FM3]|uniref:hypothetical protein n=1 Tax=Oceanisphaera sp. W20_SRM_FM3 TaxID=3240267 RepID=UPI003F9A7C7E